MRRHLLVALHDVTPVTFERCTAVRDWLQYRGIDRATLLVVPAPEGQPFSHDADLANWLRARADAGDAIAQHGYTHRQTHSPNRLRALGGRLQGGAAAEFPGLDAHETQAALEAGKRILAEGGLKPHGFVAPAYAYTPQLRAALASRFEWWTSLLRLYHRPDGRTVASLAAPALCLGTSTGWKRALSPPLIRALAAVPRRLVRIDIHPADLDLPRHRRTLATLLQQHRRGTAHTYDQLLL